MLVAEKQQYLESYDPHKYESVRVVKSPKAIPKTKEKRKNKIKPILMILVGFALGSLVVARYATIAQNHSEILRLEKVLEEEYEKESRLRLELSYSNDLNRIEEYAKNNLEMNYPDKSQVLYVDLPQPNQDEANETDEQAEIAHQDERTLWDMVVRLLD